MIEKMLEELNSLLEADKILTSIWTRLNLSTGKLDEPLDRETIDRIRKYFNFDDSE